MTLLHGEILIQHFPHLDYYDKHSFQRVPLWNGHCAGTGDQWHDIEKTANSPSDLVSDILRKIAL